MKQNALKIKWVAFGLLLFTFIFGGRITANAQTRARSVADGERSIVAWIYDYGQASPITIKVKDGEVVAYQEQDDEPAANARPKQNKSWINIIPSATIVKTSGYEDGNLSKKHEYKAKLKVANGFRNNYMIVYI